MEDREQAVQYWLNNGGKKRYGLVTVRRGFLFVTSERQLFRWKRQIERQEAPLTLTKKTVYDRLYVEFTEARQNECSVNDSDFRDWAINIANEIGISNFQASGTWITKFKQAHHIQSRKITKFVSRNYGIDEVMIEQSIKDFLASTESTIARRRKTHTHSSSQCFNAFIHNNACMDSSLLPRLYIYIYAFRSRKDH
jgi:hypothetical protein